MRVLPARSDHEGNVSAL